MRSYVREVQESAWCEVLEAADAAEAVHTARRHQGRVDVLLTDLTMPRMNGPQLAAALADDHPRLKVLYMTGYAGEAARDAVAPDGAPVLAKPFQPGDLVRTLEALLAHAAE